MGFVVLVSVAQHMNLQSHGNVIINSAVQAVAMLAGWLAGDAACLGHPLPLPDIAIQISFYDCSVTSSRWEMI